MKTVLRAWPAALFLAVAGCQPAAQSTLSMKTNSVSDPASAAAEPAASSASSTAASSVPGKTADAASGPVAALTRTDEEWRRILTPEQYHVLRQAGTERSFGPAYEEFKKQGGGTYVCAGCGAELFSSKEKFDSHCGWPSFYDPANARNVKTREDVAHGMIRTEVICARCNGHLGHVFKGEGFKTPTDTRYCINGVSLKFVPAGGTNAIDAAKDKGH